MQPVICNKDMATYFPVKDGECELWLVIVDSINDITNPSRDHAYVDSNGIFYIYNGKEIEAINDYTKIKIKWGNLIGDITDQYDLMEVLGQFVKTISVNGQNIPKNEQKNIAITIPITTIKLDGQTVSPSNYVVNLDLASTYAKKTEVPTKTSQLENDDGFVKQEEVEKLIPVKIVQVNGKALNPGANHEVNIDLTSYAIKTDVTKEIADAIAGVKQFEVKVVSSLPTTGENGIMYLVPNGDTGTNMYNEYVWVNGKYELVSVKNLDLSDYITKDYFYELTPTEIDNLVAEA